MRAVRALVHGDWTRFAHMPPAPCGIETAGPRTVQQNDDGMCCAAKPLRGLKRGMDGIHFCSQNFEYRADIGQSSTSLQLETHTQGRLGKNIQGVFHRYMDASPIIQKKLVHEKFRSSWTCFGGRFPLFPPCGAAVHAESPLVHLVEGGVFDNASVESLVV